MLRWESLRERSAARRIAGRKRVRHYGQHRLEYGLEEVLESACVGGSGGELRPVRGRREVNIWLIPLGGLVLVLVQRAVMVIVPVFDGRLVYGGLLRGGVRPTEPSQRRNRLGDDHEQRQHVYGYDPQRSGIDEQMDMEEPS